MADNSTIRASKVVKFPSVPTTKQVNDIRYDHMTRERTNIFSSPSTKMASTKVASSAATAGTTENGFNFLQLPNELRLKVYAFCLPRNERLYLDRESFHRPLPYQWESYGDTYNLLQTCRQIHTEATEFIFHNNTVNIIRPKKRGDFLAKLGGTACRFLTKLECHVYRDLGDLGKIWKTMNGCPKLEELRLVFYHDRDNWHHVATQLACHAIGKDGLVLELELYDSIWASAWYGYDTETFFSLEQADRHSQVYAFSLPPALRKVSVTASISPEIVQHLQASNAGLDWVLIHTGNQQNGLVRTLRWSGTEVGEDVDLHASGDDGW